MKCGVGDYTCYLAQALASKPEIRVGVLTSVEASQAAVCKSYDVLPVIKRWNKGCILAFVRAVRAWNPDVVHVQYPTQGYRGGGLPILVPLICFLLGRPVVQTWHEPNRGFILPYQFLKTIVPTRIVAVRPAYLALLTRAHRLALFGRDIIFIPNASSLPAAKVSEEERRELRAHYLGGQQRLLMHYGFIYPTKGVELLFRIADPARDQLVIAGEVPVNHSYGDEIRQLASTELWRGKVAILGFVPVADLVRLLAVADGVILPYRLGGGEWNTSIHGAVLQRSFVLTTSLSQRGYDNKRNVYYANVGDVEEMKSALDRYAGTRRAFDPDVDRDEWPEIAGKHHTLYSEFISNVDGSRDVQLS
jgi:glycosyltransferase involved in cell wall biosynthesis